MILARHRGLTISITRASGIDEVFVAAHSDIGPALVGLLRPRFVVRSDFVLRYTEQ